MWSSWNSIAKIPNQISFTPNSRPSKECFWGYITRIKKYALNPFTLQLFTYLREILLAYWGKIWDLLQRMVQLEWILVFLHVRDYEVHIASKYTSIQRQDFLVSREDLHQLKTEYWGKDTWEARLNWNLRALQTKKLLSDKKGAQEIQRIHQLNCQRKLSYLLSFLKFCSVKHNWSLLVLLISTW